MQITKEMAIPGGRELTIQVDNDEDLACFDPDVFYEIDLGFKKIVVSGHTFNGMTRVYWDMANQRWEPV